MDHRRPTHTIQPPPYKQYLTNAVTFPPLTPSFVSNNVCSPENMSFSNLSPHINPDQTLSHALSLLNLSPTTYACTHAPPFVPNTFSGDGGDGGDDGFVPPVMGYDDVIRQRRDYLLGFDNWFDFDRMCNLGNKRPFNLTQKFDEYEKLNLIKHSQNKGQGQSQSQDYYYNMSPWCFKKLRGRIYTMAKDQNGCRILQALFETPTAEEVEIVVSEVVGFVSDLMKDQFGNYLVQKLVAVCNDDQKMQIILSLVKDIVVVCMNPHGTRAVQKLLENLQDPNQVKLVMKGLHHGATALAVDPNGHHVIQYCLVNFHTDINMPILTEIANECYKIATDRSGCCVLQACVEHARGEVRTRIIAEIIANSVHLAEDPFGNYVLQHMVGLNIPELTALLVRQLQGNFASLSCNKYGSNVVEKCLNESGEEVSTRIVLELIRSPNSALLLVDPYANFVIQSALKVSKGFAHNCLCGLITKNIWSMQTNLYGKKILGRFNKKKVNFA